MYHHCTQKVYVYLKNPVIAAHNMHDIIKRLFVTRVYFRGEHQYFV